MTESAADHLTVLGLKNRPTNVATRGCPHQSPAYK